MRNRECMYKVALVGVSGGLYAPSVMPECDYLVSLGNKFLNFKLFAILHLSKLCDGLGDLLAPLALSHKRNDVFRTGNKPANIISKRAQDAIDIPSFESRIKLLHQLQI